MEQEEKVGPVVVAAALEAAKAEAFAAGQKAERERCHGIAVGYMGFTHARHVDARSEAFDSACESIAAAIMEDKSDE